MTPKLTLQRGDMIHVTPGHKLTYCGTCYRSVRYPDLRPVRWRVYVFKRSDGSWLELSARAARRLFCG